MEGDRHLLRAGGDSGSREKAGSHRSLEGVETCLDKGLPACNYIYPDRATETAARAQWVTGGRVGPQERHAAERFG